MSAILKKRLIYPLIAMLVICGIVFGAVTVVRADTDNLIGQRIEQMVRAIHEKVGYPSIVNGRDYQTAKEIYELRDRADFATYTYVKDRNGDLHCVALSLGYPMPASVQIANPRKHIGRTATIPQAEANGLFMPEGLSATYQRIIDPNTGEASLGFFEEEIDVYPFELPTAKTSCAIFKK